MTLAIDNGIKSGWAFINTKGRCWRCGTVKGKDPEARFLVAHMARQAGCTHAVVEDAHYQRNQATFKTLIEMRKDWESDLRAAGLIVLPAVPASTWQSKMLVWNGEKCPTGQTKAWSVKIAKALGASPKNDNEADAVCIAAWAGRQC